jgi:stress response protein YsnF
VADVPHAPFIYFEGAPLSGHVGGMIRVTLSAERVVEQKSVIATDQVVVAYLRTNVHGARELIEALRRALLLAVPVPDGKAN